MKDAFDNRLGIILVAALVLSLSSPSLSWSVEAGMPGKWETRQAQYSERSDRFEESDRSAHDRDWYEDAYEDYEESPYGYYQEGYFYNDFDLNYWKRDFGEDWYERRYRQYRRGYLDPER